MFGEPAISVKNAIESPEKQFDVYLSHDSIDKNAIRPLVLSTITVLLPGAADPHDKPAPWNASLWLDLRSGFGEAEVEQLVSVIQKTINSNQFS